MPEAAPQPNETGDPQVLAQNRIPTPNPQPSRVNHGAAINAVTRFQEDLKNNAIGRLERNQARLTQVQGTYRNTQTNNPQWGTLRTLAAQEQQFLRMQTQATHELSLLMAKRELANTDLGRFLNQTQLGRQLDLPKSDPKIYSDFMLGLMGTKIESLDPKYRQRFQELRDTIALSYGVRQDMRATHPALAVIDTAAVSRMENTPANNALIYRQMSQGFDGMRQDMAKLAAEVKQDPNKALLFDALVPQTLSAMKPEDRPHAQAWLQAQQDRDNAIKIAGGVGTAALTVGSFFAGPLGWGANVVRGLALAGGLLGAATALYEFPQLRTMDLAARASSIGGEKLTNQTPEEARMNLVMGYANLALAGLDGLQLAPAAVSRLMRIPGAARAAGKMTAQQSRVLMHSLARIKGPISEKVLKAFVETIRGTDNLLADSVAIFDQGNGTATLSRRPLSELADRLEARINSRGSGNNSAGNNFTQQLEAKGIPKAQAKAIAGKGFGAKDLDALVRSGVEPNDAARLLAQGINKAELDKLAARGLANPRGTWVFDPKQDLDWRGGQRSFQQGMDEAYRRTGVPKEYFRPTQWSRDAYGKSHPTELKVPKDPAIPRQYWDAEVNIDWGFPGERGALGPHLGYRGGGGRGRGHILMDSVPYHRPPLPQSK